MRSEHAPISAAMGQNRVTNRDLVKPHLATTGLNERINAHWPRRDVDEKARDPAVGDGFEVLTDHSDMPVVDEVVLRLDDMPCPLHELVEAPLAEDLINGE